MPSTNIPLVDRQTCAPKNNDDSQEQLSSGRVHPLKPITGYLTQRSA